MTDTAKPGRRARFVEIDETLDSEIEALAVANGRTYRAELEHAIARHLAAPPTCRYVVDAPPLPVAEVEVAAKKPPGKRRGRPRKTE
jgi:hypothetical protein